VGPVPRTVARKTQFGTENRTSGAFAAPELSQSGNIVVQKHHFGGGQGISASLYCNIPSSQCRAR
jgi:hypothetical protein